MLRLRRPMCTVLKITADPETFDSINSGFAARCEARLRLAAQFEFPNWAVPLVRA